MRAIISGQRIGRWNIEEEEWEEWEDGKWDPHTKSARQIELLDEKKEKGKKAVNLIKILIEWT